MQCSGPRPRRSVTPGRKPSNRPAADWHRRSTTSTPSGFFRSTAIERRLRARMSLGRLDAPVRRSTRMTSAPMSDNIMPQNGPGPMPASSMIRRPFNGPTLLSLIRPYGLGSLPLLRLKGTVCKEVARSSRLRKYQDIHVTQESASYPRQFKRVSALRCVRSARVVRCRAAAAGSTAHRDRVGTGELDLRVLAIERARAEQFVVRPFGDDDTGFEHDDAIRFDHRRQIDAR